MLALLLAAEVLLFTGPQDTAAYRIGRALAEASRRVQDLDLSVTPTAGSLANLDALADSGGVAIVRADILRDVQFGVGRLDRKIESLRALAVLHDETVHVVARRDLGMRSVADLAGRRVAIGPAGGGAAHTARSVLALAGVGITDLTALRMTDDEAATALLAGRIDAFIAIAPAPSPAVARALAAGFGLLAPGEEAERKVRAESFLGEQVFPLRLGAVEPADYPQLATATAAIEIATLLATTEAFPRGAAEDLVDALFASLEPIRAAHPAARAIDRARVKLEVPIPLHEGARRYYQRAGPLKGPVELHVMLWIYDISAVDMGSGTFFFDGVLEIRWADPRLTPKDAPFFEVANNVELVAEDQGVTPAGAEMTITSRLRGRVRGSFPLDRYPFDHQRFEISLEHPQFPREEVVYIPETARDPGIVLAKDRVREDFRLEDWQVVSVRDGTRDVRYGEDLYYSRYTLSVEVKRRLLQFFMKEMTPIALMVLLALGAAFLPSDKLDGKLLLTVLALLVAVELQVAHSERMPPVGYLTLADWLYVFAYFSISLSVLQSIVEYRLHASGHDVAASRVRHAGLALASGIFVVPVAILIAVRL